MTDANMICPGCKTFQPRAQTCQQCGAIVAKLWARESPAARTHERETPGDGPMRPVMLAGAGALVIAVAGYGIWSLMQPGDGFRDDVDRRPGIHAYLEAARGAQHAAAMTRARMEAAVYEAESGIVALGPRGFPDADEVGLDRDRLAGEINAVSQTEQVQVTGADLQPTINQCARFPQRYFRPLRFGSAEAYPIAEPESQPYVPGALQGRYRCEGGEGTIYTNSAPRSQDGLNACWMKQEPPRRTPPGQDNRRPDTLWVRMKWDAEAQSWAIYSRADQRSVDEARLLEARHEYESDIKRVYGRREDHARERIADLVTTIGALREALAIAAGEALRERHSRSLANAEQKLRKALVERRYLWLCNTAARAALDRVEQNLTGQ